MIFTLCREVISDHMIVGEFAVEPEYPYRYHNFKEYIIGLYSLYSLQDNKLLTALEGRCLTYHNERGNTIPGLWREFLGSHELSFRDKEDCWNNCVE